MQDAIVSSTNQKSNKRVKDEQEFYDYEVYSPVSFAQCIFPSANLNLYTYLRKHKEQPGGLSG